MAAFGRPRRRTHRETLTWLHELGVNWVHVNGHGRTEKEALTWIERYRDAVLAPAGIVD